MPGPVVVPPSTAPAGGRHLVSDTDLLTPTPIARPMAAPTEPPTEAPIQAPKPDSEQGLEDDMPPLPPDDAEIDRLAQQQRDEQAARDAEAARRAEDQRQIAAMHREEIGRARVRDLTDRLAAIDRRLADLPDRDALRKSECEKRDAFQRVKQKALQAWEQRESQIHTKLRRLLDRLSQTEQQRLDLLNEKEKLAKELGDEQARLGGRART